MNKKTLLVSVFLFLVYISPALSQQIAILKPAKWGEKSEAIPLSNKQYKKLVGHTFSKIPGPNLKATHAGILDTLKHPFDTNVNWGIAAGDTQASYYEPSAACVIKAVGIVSQSWSTEQLSDVFNLEIRQAPYGWQFPDDWWDGDGIYTKDHGLPTLLGDRIWGDYPCTISDGDRIWTEMMLLGTEPDVGDDGFIISIVPHGGSYMGTDCASYNSSDTSDVYRLAKFYQAGRNGHEPQFVVRPYSLTWIVIVEFYENTPPQLEPEVYSTVLNADAKEMRCHITDVDANDDTKAGVQAAILHYRVNSGNWHTLSCSLISGTNRDGIWRATIPSGYMFPGDVLTYYFTAVDYAGATSSSQENSFTYFNKTEDILVFYNDDGGSFPSWILSPYYDNLWLDEQNNPYGYDVWVGLTDGPLSHALIDQYQTIVQIDAFSPATLVDDTLSSWFASGTKYMFWSSQDWAGVLLGGFGADDDTTFAVDDWHYRYMGLEYVGGTGHDIASDPFRINPIQGDLISGPLFDFIGDSLGLYINTDYELGWRNWSDAFIPAGHAVVCFTDSAEGRAMGVHTAYSGSKTAFIAFDQLCLDTYALPNYTASDGYHWVEPNVHSVADAALDWFFSGTSNPPDIDISPSSFTFLADVGDSSNATLTIANIAAAENSELNWSIAVSEVGLTVGSYRKSNTEVRKFADKLNLPKNNLPHLELAKGEADPRRGQPVVDSKGGPDNFGYRWIDSDESNGPAFNWIDISGTGTSVNLGDDSFVEVTLPFTFSFYGENKTEVKISSNGYLTFGGDGNDFSNDAIPDSKEPNDIICPFWDDLSPNVNGVVYYKKFSDKFIVQYSDVRRYSSGTGGYTFQVILFKTGAVKFQYLNMNGTLNGATVGIENNDGSDGLEIAFNAYYIHDSLAVMIDKGIQWLEISPVAGSTGPGQSDTVQVKVNATGLSAGTHEAQLEIISNDPDEPTILIPISFIVRGECQSPYLKATDVSALSGEISVAILIEQNPQPIDAFGFQFSFDSTKLSFNRLEKGALTQNFSYFQAYQNSAGAVTIGGFNDTPIPANSSDTLAIIVLDIEPTPCDEGGHSPLLLSELVDDLAGLNICNGIFRCEPNCLLGDVNWDGDVTPDDALCAFNIFLNDGVPPGNCDNLCALEAADINCTPNGITPGDALYIFLGYLNGEEPPLPCDPTSRMAVQNVSDTGILKFERIGGSADGEVTFALHLQNRKEIQAFGMAIGFPDNLLQFSEVLPGTVTENWQVFGGQESIAGVIYLGGFHNEAKELKDDNILAYLKFKSKPEAAGSGEIWIYNLSDDLAGSKSEKFNFSTLPTGVKIISDSEIPDEYRLHQNFPNPFNLKTEIVYELPEPAHVTIDLFNTTGQRIRRLVSQQHPAGKFSVQWDGKDEAGNIVSTGVYIYRMKTPAFSSINKLILVK